MESRKSPHRIHAVLTAADPGALYPDDLAHNLSVSAKGMDLDDQVGCSLCKTSRTFYQSWRYMASPESRIGNWPWLAYNVERKGCHRVVPYQSDAC